MMKEAGDLHHVSGGFENLPQYNLANYTWSHCCLHLYMYLGILISC